MPSRAEPLRLWGRPQGRNRVRLRDCPPGLSRIGFGIVFKCEACQAKPSGNRPADSRKEPSQGKGQAGPMFFSCEVALRNFCPFCPPDFSYLPFSSYLSKFWTNILSARNYPLLTRGQRFHARTFHVRLGANSIPRPPLSAAFAYPFLPF